MKNTIKNKTKNANKKQSLLFSFCNIFDVLTSRTQKIAWSPLLLNLIFTYFPIMKNLKKFDQQAFIVSYLLKEKH